VDARITLVLTDAAVVEDRDDFVSYDPYAPVRLFVLVIRG
jgi:hypothetical protein